MAPRPATDRRLQRLAAAFTPAWLAAQRWFRTKSRRVASVALDDAAELDGGGWLLVLTATDDAGTISRYLVPAVADGDEFREPRDGEGVWLRLVALMANGGEVAAQHGRFAFRAGPALARLLPDGDVALARLSEHRLGVEQSNTSVAIGERLILKCYRLLEAGPNPEVEVTSFLSTVGFTGAPALAGRADYQPAAGAPRAAAMLQELVSSNGNGWVWALELLAGGEHGRARAVAGIAQLGRLTRRLHDALGSRPATPGFPSRPATDGELATWRARADEQLDGALEALQGTSRRQLEGMTAALRDQLDAIQGARRTRVTRIHGDYHLGQVLRTARGFKVIDFEGEPARPLAERNEPASPLRDVAGMLRSIDYVAQVAHRERGLADPEAWAREAQEAFLSSYGPISPADARLSRAFQVEKACYEVHYEANMRPGWEWIPLGALERLADREAPPRPSQVVCARRN